LVDAARFRSDLARFDPDMGQVNRHLVLANHDASRHAVELVALFGRLAPTPVQRPELLDPLAAMVRVQWETEERVALAETDCRRLRIEAAGLRDRHDGLQAHLDAVLSGRRYRVGRLIGSPVGLARRLRGRREQA
jgi:hypothetical protein